MFSNVLSSICCGQAQGDRPIAASAYSTNYKREGLRSKIKAGSDGSEAAALGLPCK